MVEPLLRLFLTTPIHTHLLLEGLLRLTLSVLLGLNRDLEQVLIRFGSKGKLNVLREGEGSLQGLSFGKLLGVVPRRLQLVFELSDLLGEFSYSVLLNADLSLQGLISLKQLPIFLLNYILHLLEVSDLRFVMLALLRLLLQLIVQLQRLLPKQNELFLKVYCPIIRKHSFLLLICLLFNCCQFFLHRLYVIPISQQKLCLVMLNHFVYLLVHYFNRLEQILVDLVCFGERTLFSRRPLLFGRNVHANDQLINVIQMNKNNGSIDQELVVIKRIDDPTLCLGVTLRISLTFSFSF